MTFSPMSRDGCTVRRHLLSLNDLDAEDLNQLVLRGVRYAAWPDHGEPLAGTVLGVYFRRTSTRTRTAFTTAALRLGARVIAYGPNDLQLETGESIEDTGRVLSSMLDGLVARTADDTGELRAYAAQNRMSVINAMSAQEHPTQALSDLSTMFAHFGGIDGLRVLYIGEGNNTAVALALALARFARTTLYLRTPPGYGLDEDVLKQARLHAQSTGSIVEESHDPYDLPESMDVVYTTRWQTTGTSKPDPDWRTVFAPFRVDRAVLEANPQAEFMHDLPAHRGEEVTAEVLDGPRSLAFRQAENKLYSAMAVLEWCLRG
ncbi:ornithine carbamoyltransferase [Frankia sp. AiPs1]|uniref:ornithine carbamoyltransferase n=1 Tax=Frankia sp. AiPa1 TaxID=573492 RepID=UPI00202B2B0C|nr:ornithine carbamoyltransferase [Frankia sp. AiPa1]MCL9758109.1 ornithine carbamoyltransferase [Frankia sp. AiPa1]